MQRLTAGLATIAVALMFTQPAHAATNAGPPDSGHQLIDYGTWGVEVTYTATADQAPPTALKKGQSLTLDTSGGETTYAQLSGDCTATINAGAPSKGTYNSKPAATGVVSFSLSSGCSDQKSWGARLQWEDCAWWHGCDWKDKGFDADLLNPGTSVQVRFWSQCGNSDSDRWRTGGAWSGLSYLNSSAVSLNCGF